MFSEEEKRQATVRYEGLLSLDRIQETSAVVVGCGATGGYITPMLARAGMKNIYLSDMDFVSVENLGMQNYCHKDLGRHKSFVLKEMVDDITTAPERCEAKACRVLLKPNEDVYQECSYQDLCPDEPYVLFMCADSMLARKEAALWAFRSRQCQYLVETRMSGLNAEAYIVDATDPKALIAYKKGLFPDSEAIPLPCTSKATMFTAGFAANMAVSQLFLAMSGKEYSEACYLAIPGMDAFCMEEPNA